MAEPTTIGKRKYEALKSLNLDNLTEETLDKFSRQFPSLTVSEAMKSITDFEQNSTFIPNVKSIREYADKIFSEKKEVEKIEMTKDWLWKKFVANYRESEGVNFSTDPESLENIKPLFFYFLGDEDNFVKCKNVSLVSKPSLKKGLLIIGGYGNGKTSIMNAIEKSLVGTNVAFKGFTTNNVVMLYESCENAAEKKEFYRRMTTGTLYFDDLLTEREASNYGKSDLFKELLEERYKLRKRTYVTLNYKNGTNNNLQIGLEQLGVRYGSRVYDRLFDMFNVIEFTGKSFRK